MKKLIQVLRDRRGESMVEILVSTVVFMLLLGALNGAVGFASNAQRKAEQLREDAVVLQREVRAGTPAGEDRPERLPRPGQKADRDRPHPVRQDRPLLPVREGRVTA